MSGSAVVVLRECKGTEEAAHLNLAHTSRNCKIMVHTFPYRLPTFNYRMQ